MFDSDDQNRKDPARDVVAFRVGDQDFCIEIVAVREIRGWTETTPLPHAQNYVKGVINLRGSVVAVIDLSARLGLGATQPTPRHVIIITKIGRQIVGLLADLVSDILSLDYEGLQPMPQVASEEAREFITGLATLDDGRLIRKLDLERLLPEMAAEPA